MINKLLLTGLTLLPLVNGSVNATTANNVSQIKTDTQEPTSNDSCTIMYVGKDVSQSGRAYISRCGDTSPTALNMNMQIFKHNELANQVVKGKNGFEWKMPSETYKYIAFPRNPMMNKGLHWEVAGINENGVAISATLSCATNDKAKSVDPLCLKTGITEDNLTQIVAATAKTAKEGVQYVAHIVDTVGNAEENAIMIADKNEAWYMELYTGHQYCAIKMPDDKITTIGNEFMLNTLGEYSDVITSSKLFTMPKENGFAQYEGGNLHLFKTYARPLTWTDEKGVFHDTDGCHMRTWRGINLFCKEQYPDYLTYKNDVKYPSFFRPDRKLSSADVIVYMRDRYEDILTNSQNPNFNYFYPIYKNHKLRCVADESTYNVHVISINPDLPAETSVEEWYCLSNSMYSPFIPISNGVEKLNDYYSHVTPYYGFDEESAICIFKRLNSLAAVDHTNYGKPTHELILEHEDAWRHQYDQLIEQIKPLNVDKQKEVLTNYSLQVQKEALQMSNMLYEDLLWHHINVTKSYYGQLDKLFKPFVSIEYYSYLYGWDYSKKDNIITLTQGNDTLTIDTNYKWGEGNEGSISHNGAEIEKCKVQIRYDVPYINYQTARKYMAIKYKLRDLDINDYFNKLNPLCWILPVSIGVPLVVGGTVAAIIITKKHKKNKNKK